jgi:glycosyltransferase involved in cell wall biosynthesis
MIDNDDIIRFAWLARTDLRAPNEYDEVVPPWFTIWCAVQGRRDHPACFAGMDFTDLELLYPLPDVRRHGYFGMSPLLAYLLERRADLRAEFAVETDQGLWAALAWLYVHGLVEHAMIELVPRQIVNALDEVPEILKPWIPVAAHQQAPTWLMFFAWRCSAELQAAFDLRSQAGQAALVAWFVCEGAASLGLTSLLTPRWRHWMSRPVSLTRQDDVAIPVAGWLMWKRRSDLQRAFDITTLQGRTDLSRWSQSMAEVETALAWIAGRSPRVRAASRAQRLHPVRPFGVNLVGFAFGELGIGEDIRMAVAACEQAKIPFSIVNICPGNQLRQADRELDAFVDQANHGAEEAPYAVNIFCLTAFDTARVLLERGKSFFEGRTNIGWWPWELPVWPRTWNTVFKLVDEVWAATEFTQRMYTRAMDSVPHPVTVSLMPMAVCVARVSAITRAQLGLPDARRLYLYVFDFNSYLERKNPQAVLKAFLHAFPDDRRDVGLVLKTMNSDPENERWRDFVAECQRHEGVFLLNTTLDRRDVLGLIQCCDVYISLHRSEGFGRTMAEAMCFGKPVIGTNFSGNVDFLQEATGFPVQWSVRGVLPGEYPFVTAADNAWWADPEPADAAKQILAALKEVGNDAFRDRIRTQALARFSPANVGVRMRRRLEDLFSAGALAASAHRRSMPVAK